MAVYAIGDIQGCFDELVALLDTLAFEPRRDVLWFVGDLVNRGPKSLDVLRFIKSLGDRAITVLGNHDLHLLAVAHAHERPRRKDTLDDILRAPDRDDLLDWLRHQPLLHHDAALGFTMVHAGLPPQWNLTEARAYALEVEEALRGPSYIPFLEHMYGDKPTQWSARLDGWERLRFITNCFTRLRFCDAQGRLALDAKGPPGTQSAPYLPWFEVPLRRSRDCNIVFGHWSALGNHAAHQVYALDTGCLWGGELTALRLDGAHREKSSVVCPAPRRNR